MAIRDANHCEAARLQHAMDRATACSVSSKCSTVPIEHTASNDASANGIARTSETTACSASSPKLRRASRAIGGDRSIPNAVAPRSAPLQDASVPGFVPQIGLQNPQSGQPRQACSFEEADLVLSIEERRGRAAEIGEVVADVLPEPVAWDPLATGFVERSRRVHDPATARARTVAIDGVERQGVTPGGSVNGPMV